jgi:hypothetical protein
MAAVEFEEGGLSKDAAVIGRELIVEPNAAQPSTLDVGDRPLPASMRKPSI